MTSFFQSLQLRCTEINSILCIGLDPHAAELKENTPKAAFEFCKEIIQSTHEFAAAYKPNAAFFEALGHEGVAMLHEVIKIIPEGIPVLLDAKRGDISTTAAAYATAAFNVAKADAITVNAYMGFDSVAPFLEDKSKGVFVLCKTSNPTSNEFQTLELSKGGMLFEEMARRCEKWNKETNNVGVVVGATDIDALARTRAAAPSIWILAPGVGAQGGDPIAAVSAGIRSDGFGMLVPVSRGISRAEDRRAAAIDLRDKFNAARASSLAPIETPSITVEDKSALKLKPYQREFIKFAEECKVLRFGEFKLKSGRVSPYFFNAGLFKTGKQMLALGKFYAHAIKDSGIEFDVIFGPAYKGIPLAAGIAMSLSQIDGLDYPFAYNRKEKKDHGEGGVLVGSDVSNQRILLVDDVITAGTAIREALVIMNHEAALVSGVCVALDRQEKVTESSNMSAIQKVEEEFGFPVVSIVKLEHVIAYLAEKGGGVSEHLDSIKVYRTRFGVE